MPTLSRTNLYQFLSVFHYISIGDVYVRREYGRNLQSSIRLILTLASLLLGISSSTKSQLFVGTSGEVSTGMLLNNSRKLHID